MLSAITHICPGASPFQAFTWPCRTQSPCGLTYSIFILAFKQIINCFSSQLWRNPERGIISTRCQLFWQAFAYFVIIAVPPFFLPSNWSFPAILPSSLTMSKLHVYKPNPVELSWVWFSKKSSVTSSWIFLVCRADVVINLEAQTGSSSNRCFPYVSRFAASRLFN